jgi:hypothetical protein
MRAPELPFPSVFRIVDVYGKEEGPEIGGEVPEIDPRLQDGSANSRSQIPCEISLVVTFIDLMGFVIGQPVDGASYYAYVGAHVRHGEKDENAALRVGRSAEVRILAQSEDLSQKERCADDSNQSAPRADREVDGVGADDVGMVAERQTDEGGGVRTCHDPLIYSYY